MKNPLTFFLALILVGLGMLILASFQESESPRGLIVREFSYKKHQYIVVYESGHTQGVIHAEHCQEKHWVTTTLY